MVWFLWVSVSSSVFWAFARMTPRAIIHTVSRNISHSTSQVGTHRTGPSSQDLLRQPLSGHGDPLPRFPGLWACHLDVSSHLFSAVSSSSTSLPSMSLGSGSCRQTACRPSTTHRLGHLQRWGSSLWESLEGLFTRFSGEDDLESWLIGPDSPNGCGLPRLEGQLPFLGLAVDLLLLTCLPWRRWHSPGTTGRHGGRSEDAGLTHGGEWAFPTSSFHGRLAECSWVWHPLGQEPCARPNLPDLTGRPWRAPIDSEFQKAWSVSRTMKPRCLAGGLDQADGRSLHAARCWVSKGKVISKLRMPKSSVPTPRGR